MSIEAKPISLERIKRLRNAALANLGIMVGSIGGSMLTGNPVYDGEAIHSGSDAGVHSFRYLAEKLGWNQDSILVSGAIRTSMLVPGVFLGYTSMKAGIDLINQVEVPNNTVANITGALAIVGTNWYAYNQVNQIEEHSHASHASHSHAKTDMVVSSAYSAGLAGEAVGLNGTSNAVTFFASGLAAAHLVKESISRHPH